MEDEAGRASSYRATYDACLAALAESRWRAASEVCAGPSKAHFHNYCYVEHVVEWRAAFGTTGYRLVKTEDLKDASKRGAIMADLFAWLGVAASQLPASELEVLYNSHSLDAELPDEFHRCLAVMKRPDSYLSTCNARLAALEGDEKWLWWPRAPGAAVPAPGSPGPPPPHYSEEL